MISNIKETFPLQSEMHKNKFCKIPGMSKLSYMNVDTDNKYHKILD